MKKSFLIIAVLLIMIVAISCGRMEVQKAEEPVKEQQTEVAEPQGEKTLTVPEAEKTEVPADVVAAEQIVQEPVQEPVQSENEKCIVEANGYRLEVLKARIDKDADGNDIVVVTVLFTNTNSSEMQFRELVVDDARQNGSKLGEDVPFMGENFMNAMQWISNGKTIPVDLPYRLNDPNTAVDFTIKIFNFEKQAAIAEGSCTLALEK